ncbi:MAG: N-acetylmuramic acid 6-phosphate etherase [Acidobacteriota bacterium]
MGELLTEQSHSASKDLDLLSTAQLLAVISAADAEVASAVALQTPKIARTIDAIAPRLSAGGRLFYLGAGTSGRLGVLDASECPPTFGVSPDLVQGIIAGGPPALTRAVEAVEDNAAAGAADLLQAGFQPSDCLVGIAASGRTPYVIGALQKARAMGALTCSITCVPDSPVAQAAEFPIEILTGPEILTGSTRLRAGTATKMVLNMISTAVMVRLGHVYGNLMVNVAPTNQKLEARACRIIQQITGVSPQHAAQLLADAGRSVRVAIIMEKKALSRAEAEALLAKSHGRLRQALE